MQVDNPLKMAHFGLVDKSTCTPLRGHVDPQHTRTISYSENEYIIWIHHTYLHPCDFYIYVLMFHLYSLSVPSKLR